MRSLFKKKKPTDIYVGVAKLRDLWVNLVAY